MNRYRLSDLVACRLARRYCDLYGRPFFVVVGDFSGYDMKSVDGEISIEVKMETTPRRTGNVAIEFWNTELAEPSGILGTSANLWLHIIPEGGAFVAYEFDVNTLRKLVIEEGVVKSNNRNALCKIIAVDVFKQHALRHFELGTIEDVKTREGELAR